MGTLNPFTLAADNSPSLLPLLRSDASLASKQDEHGYSLMHAATSYGHVDLLRSLANEFDVDVNIRDEDGETALFVVETVEIAQLLVEGLGADVDVTNNDGQTAEEKIKSEGDYPTVATFLREVRFRSNSTSTISAGMQSQIPSDGSDIFVDEPPGLMPRNIRVNVGTMEETQGADGHGDIDPEFKKRIEELASREDFNSAEGQQQLRDLVHDAVKEVDVPTTDRDVRQRLR